MISAVPTLDAIAQDPELVRELPRAMLGQLLERVAIVQARLQYAVYAVAMTAPTREEDRLLTTKEAAARLGRTTTWLYAHADDLPFTVRENGQHPRFSLRGLEAYISRRAGE